MPAAPDRRALTERVKARALALGFAGAGVAAAGPALSHGFYGEWLAGGHAGAMGYLKRHAPLKADPRRVLPDARSLLLVSCNYRPPEAALPPGLRGQVARYARGGDYHEVLRAKLERLAAAIAEEAGHPVRARPFVDTAPVMEREWAARAGLGWIGKHANLIHWQHGSWLFLGGLMLDLDLEPDEPAAAAQGAWSAGAVPAAPPSGTALSGTALSGTAALDALRAQESCGACRICLDACPTGAIVADKTVDARLCIAYLTIELKGPVPQALRPQLGSWVFGCDVCQDVCPWNRGAPETREPAFTGTAERAWPDLIGLLALDEPGFRARFGGTALSRTRRQGLARNAALALGNRLAEAEAGGAPVTPAEREAAASTLTAALADEKAVVRGAAAWALARAGLTTARDALAAAHARETDADTRAELSAALAGLAAHPAAGVA